MPSLLALRSLVCLLLAQDRDPSGTWGPDILPPSSSEHRIISEFSWDFIYWASSLKIKVISETGQREKGPGVYVMPWTHLSSTWTLRVHRLRNWGWKSLGICHILHIQSQGRACGSEAQCISRMWPVTEHLKSQPMFYGAGLDSIVSAYSSKCRPADHPLPM